MLCKSVTVCVVSLPASVHSLLPTKCPWFLLILLSSLDQIESSGHIIYPRNIMVVGRGLPCQESSFWTLIAVDLKAKDLHGLRALFYFLFPNFKFCLGLLPCSGSIAFPSPLGDEHLTELNSASVIVVLRGSSGLSQTPIHPASPWL